MTTAHALTTHDSEAPVPAPAHDALAPARRHDLLRLATAGSIKPLRIMRGII